MSVIFEPVRWQKGGDVGDVGGFQTTMWFTMAQF
jgi:hypothetical protein